MTLFFWETKQTKQNEGKTRDAIVIVYGIGVVYQKGRRVYQHHFKMRCFVFFLFWLLLLLLFWSDEKKQNEELIDVDFLSLSLSFGGHLFRRKKKTYKYKNRNVTDFNHLPNFLNLSSVLWCFL